MEEGRAGIFLISDCALDWTAEMESSLARQRVCGLFWGFWELRLSK